MPFGGVVSEHQKEFFHSVGRIPGHPEGQFQNWCRELELRPKVQALGSSSQVVTSGSQAFVLASHASASGGPVRIFFLNFEHFTLSCQGDLSKYRGKADIGRQDEKMEEKEPQKMIDYLTRVEAQADMILSLQAESVEAERRRQETREAVNIWRRAPAAKRLGSASGTISFKPRPPTPWNF